MKIVEKLIKSKTDNMHSCEDAYFFNEHFAAVIDGATSVSDRLYTGKTPGRLAAETIKIALSSLSGKETLMEIIDLINFHYKQLFKRLRIEEEVKETAYLRPSASMIIYSKYHHKVWMIGDCQCFFNGKLYQNIKHIDLVFSEVRSILLKSELIEGKSKEELAGKDIGFELIKPMIQKQYNFQNTSPDCSLSYAVINGFPIPPELIKTIVLPENLANLSLASDGYPKIYGSLKESEDELARLNREDPLCINENKGVKGIKRGNVSFDDRTYIRISLLNSNA